MQDKVFFLNLALKYVRSSEIPVWSAEPDHAEPKPGLHHQIVMWYLRLFRDIPQRRLAINDRRSGTTY